jgi:hypothetical protein
MVKNGYPYNDHAGALTGLPAEYSILVRGKRVGMNLEKTSLLFILIIMSAAFSNCTGSSGSSTRIPVVTPDPITPLRTTTPVTLFPVGEIARVRVDHFGMNPATETIFEFVGTVMVNSGVFRSVQVILRYPDSQEYIFDAGGMGGANPTAKAFSLYPADRYKGKNPEKIIVLDGIRYWTVYRYENGGLSWIAMAGNRTSP